MLMARSYDREFIYLYTLFILWALASAREARHPRQDSTHITSTPPSAQDTAGTTSLIEGAVVLQTVESLSNGSVATISETFVPTVYSRHTGQTDTSTVSIKSQNATYSVVIGPGGVGWKIPTLTSGEPVIQPPPTAPVASGSNGKPLGSGSPSSTSSTIPKAKGSPASMSSTPSPKVLPSATSPSSSAVGFVTATDGSEATGVVTATDGSHHTTIVVWKSTEISAGRTLKGIVISTPEPAWSCVGSLCNPDCLIPLESCQPTDEHGKSGIDGFAFATKPPPTPPKQPTTKPSVQPSTSTKKASKSLDFPEAAGKESKSTTKTSKTSASSTTSHSSPKFSKATSKESISTTTTSSKTTSSTTDSWLGPCAATCSACNPQASPTEGVNAKSVTTNNVTNSPILPKRALPKPGPDENESSWFVDRVEKADEKVPHLVDQPSLFGEKGILSSILRLWTNEQKSYAVDRIFGCTSILITSHAGLYMSHIWEQPSMDPEGGGGINPDGTDSEPFLDIFAAMNGGSDGYLAGGTTKIHCEALVGSDIGLQEFKPKVLIMTPFTWSLPGTQKRDESGPVCVTTLATSARSSNTSEFPPTSSPGPNSSNQALSTTSTNANTSEKPSSSKPSSAPQSTTIHHSLLPVPGLPVPGHATPTPSAAAYKIHIWQGLGQEIGQADVYLYANISTDEGISINANQSKLDWGKPLALMANTNPKHALLITPETGVKAKRRTNGDDGAWYLGKQYFQSKREPLGAPVAARPLYEKGPVNVVIDNGKPVDVTNITACHSGAWDNGNAADFFKTLFGFEEAKLPNREIDCVFTF